MERSAVTQMGTGLVDVMVGVAAALFAVLVIYVVVAQSDRFRHDAQSAGDAQQTGLFALSRLSFDIGNAGNGFAAAARAMSTCPPSASVVDTLRPVAILITDSGGDDIPDSVVIRYGVSSSIARAVPFAQAVGAGESFFVRRPFSFAVGDRVIAVGRNGDCAAAEVTGSSVAAPGVVEIAHTPPTAGFPSTAWLVDLGPTKDAQIIRYDVVAGVLRTTDLQNGDAPNPLASNIVNLKLQYGIDADGDGMLDTWVPAKAGAAKRPGEWNTMEITLNGDRISVSLNGQEITRFDPATAKIPPRKESWEPQLGPRPEVGHIGLQNHSDKDTVWFRKVSVRPLNR